MNITKKAICSGAYCVGIEGQHACPGSSVMITTAADCKAAAGSVAVAVASRREDWSTAAITSPNGETSGCYVGGDHSSGRTPICRVGNVGLTLELDDDDTAVSQVKAVKAVNAMITTACAAAAEYELGISGTNECDARTAKITTAAECEATLTDTAIARVVPKAELRFEGVENTSSMPSGCYLDETGRKVLFNEHGAGQNRNGRLPICKPVAAAAAAAAVAVKNATIASDHQQRQLQGGADYATASSNASNSSYNCGVRPVREEEYYVPGCLDYDPDQLNWGRNSMLYAFTVFTTVGYGTFVPATDEGRTFTILWGMVGLLLYSAACAPLSALVVDGSKAAAGFLCRKFGQVQRRVLGSGGRSGRGSGARRVVMTAEQLAARAKCKPKGKGGTGATGKNSAIDTAEAAERPPPPPPPGALVFALLVFVVVLYLGGMASWFLAREPGFATHFEGFYFAFITSTTIGFGDFAPDLTLSEAGAYFWMYGGLILMGAVLGLFNDGCDVGVAAAKAVVELVRVKLQGGTWNRSGEEEEGDSEDDGAEGNEGDGAGSALARSKRTAFSVLRPLLALSVYLLVGGAVLGSEWAGERQLEHARAVAVHHGIAESRLVLKQELARVQSEFADVDPTAVAAAMDDTLALLQAMGTCDLPPCPADATECAAESGGSPSSGDGLDVIRSNWDMYPATLYLFTVLSTVGYGHFNVQTETGRSFVMWYSLVGMFLFQKVMSAIGAALRPAAVWLARAIGKPVEVAVNWLSARHAVRIQALAMPRGAGAGVGAGAGDNDFDNGRKRGMSAASGVAVMAARVQTFFRCLYVVVYVSSYASIVAALTALFFVTGAAVFKGLALREDAEKWAELKDGIWFMFVTSSTIGFGDKTPNFRKGHTVLINMLFVTVGLALMALALATLDDGLEQARGMFQHDEGGTGTGKEGSCKAGKPKTVAEVLDSNCSAGPRAGPVVHGRGRDGSTTVNAIRSSPSKRVII
jgi:hypothetical protein